MSAPKEMNSLLYAMTKKPFIGRTRLMKFIFFVDAVSFYQRGKPVFEPEYLRMPQGHVPPAAYSVTGEPNDFFDVTYPKFLHPHYGFHPKMDPDLQVFSKYELFLIDMVLMAIGNHTAKDASKVTHRFKSWEENPDGSRIPIEQCISGDEEWKILEEFGAYLGEFQKFFKLQSLANAISKENNPDDITLLTRYIDEFERELDVFIQSYPVDTFSEFYEAHLAWDDTIRLALQGDPATVSQLTSDHCDAFYFVTGGLSTKMIAVPDIGTYCKEYYSKLEETREGLLKQKTPPYRYPAGGVDNIVSEVMQVSRDLAMQSPSGR